MRWLAILTFFVSGSAVAQDLNIALENQITQIARERCSSELIEGKDYTITAQANGDVSVRFIGQKGAGLGGSFVYSKEEWSGKRKVAPADQLEKDKSFQSCVVEQVKDLSLRYVPDKPKPKISRKFSPTIADHDVLAVVMTNSAAAVSSELRLAIDRRFDSSRQFDAYNLADYQLESFAGDLEGLRAAGFDYLLAYSVRSASDQLSTSFILTDLHEQVARRKSTVQVDAARADSVTDLSVKTWRAVEGGDYPEASVWRPGIGYCDKLLSVSQHLPGYKCADAESHFGFDKPDQYDGAISECLSLWNKGPASQGMENSCQWTCSKIGATPEKVSLYFRANAEVVSGGKRLTKRDEEERRARFGPLPAGFVPMGPRDYHDAPEFVASLRRDLVNCLVVNNGWVEDTKTFPKSGQEHDQFVERFAFVKSDNRRGIVLEHGRPMLGGKNVEYLQHFYRLHFLSL